jgi:hypothetical protein
MISVKARHVTTKFISIFLLTFVCLNAGGAMCVTYCLTSERPAQASASHHCESAEDESGDGRVSLLPARDAGPCPMTASLIGGPIERPIVTKLKVLPAAVASPEHFRTHFPRFRNYRAPVAYRGPPLLDHRIERIRHVVLLI